MKYLVGMKRYMIFYLYYQNKIKEAIYYVDIAIQMNEKNERLKNNKKIYLETLKSNF